MTKRIPGFLQRSAMVYGIDALQSLSKSSVIIFGLGGVGSWCAESLIRSGVGSLTLVDSDIICETNINRQLQATSMNTGKIKVYELADRLRAINPNAVVIPIHDVYEEKNAEKFILSSFDCAIDAIDSVSNKLHLIENAYSSGTAIFSSMGAAAKTDPTRIKISTIGETVNCPLARIMRRELRKRGIPLTIPCVFSDEVPSDPKFISPCGTSECSCNKKRDSVSDELGREIPDWCSKKKRINGAVVHITAIFGFMLSYLAIEKLTVQSDSIMK